MSPLGHRTLFMLHLNLWNKTTCLKFFSLFGDPLDQRQCLLKRYLTQCFFDQKLFIQREKGKQMLGDA